MAYSMGGKGGSERIPMTNPEATVWVGGLPEGITPAILTAFMNQAGTCMRAETKSKGTGICVFSSGQEASLAIKTLNNSNMNGSIIQVDSWTKSANPRPRSKGDEGGKGGWGGGGKGGWAPAAAAPSMSMSWGAGGTPVWQAGPPVWQPQFQKNWSGKGSWSSGKGGSKGNRNDRVRDPTKSVWLGNLPEGVPFKEVQELMNTAGNCKWAETQKGGNGFAVFTTPEEATTAIQILNGAMLGDNAIVVDAWEKKPKGQQ